MKLPPFHLALVCLGLLSACSLQDTQRSDKPLSGAEAAKELSWVPLPKSASSVYYLSHSGGMQYFELYLRFDVDAQELDAAVDELVSWNNRQMSRALAYPKEEISASDLPPVQKEFAPMPWWDPASVSSGYYRGHRESHALSILVDEENSRVYLHQND